ncbi:MAG: class II aldolase/adducin family protein [Clostridia bacterium]|nr:class II aldolase/adducin family protein [Clostridia bacterium]
MEKEQAKSLVIQAGKMLCENGLIQRTWGNVSCRIDENYFAITPSGRDYLSLTPEDIVVVNVHDLTYAGEIKPSSEKGIHAECYKLRAEVDFVIHTHQTFASLAGLSGRDINDLTGKSEAVIGNNVPLAGYGLPGTGKLRQGVVAALKRSSSKAVLMHHHGALCLGGSLEDAFAVANELEEVCRKALFARYTELTGKVADDFASLAEYVAETRKKGEAAYVFPAYRSERRFDIIELTPAAGGNTVAVDIRTGLPLDQSVGAPEAALLHSMIYRKRPDVNAVLHSTDAAATAASKIGRTVKPFLDDFAQITGVSLKCAAFDPDRPKRSAQRIVKKLRGRNAVLIENSGALCVGSSEDDAQAVKLVTEKGCMASTAADLYGKEKDRIRFSECLLMRVIYKTKYAKKAQTNKKGN